MGFILSKFRRSKPSTKELLEAIDKELRSIQRFQVDTELRQKKIIGRLIIISSVLYLVATALLYFLAPRGLPWKEQLKFFVPFVTFPFLIWGVKKFVTWYYEQRIIRKKEKYEELKKEKQRILEDVIDNETFKVGKEILEKYAPSQLIPKHMTEQFSALQSMTSSMSPLPLTPQGQRGQQLAIGATPSRSGFDAGLRRRQAPGGRMSMPGGMSTPVRPPFPRQQPGLAPLYPGQFGPRQYLRQSTNNINRPVLALTQGGQLPFSPQSVRFRPGAPPTPQPMYALPQPPTDPVVQNRSMGWMDKLVEYVVGDGPNSRYALICRYCATHNGLATAEEFPYLGYRCAFCKQYNPPKQTRPSAPKLPTNTVLIEELESSIKSEKSESPVVTHETDSETEKGSDSPAVSKPAEESAQLTPPEGTDLAEEIVQDDSDEAPVKPEEDEATATTSTDNIEYIDSSEPSEEAKNRSCESMEIDNGEGIEKVSESKETAEGFQIIDAPKVPENIANPPEDIEKAAE